MSIKVKCILALIVLGLVDMIIPVPITAVVLLYVILERPTWFMNAVREIYDAG
ncbi:MAG: hypothetical protein ACR2RB_00145 [Gammaproteobacteria bacterium]